MDSVIMAWVEERLQRLREEVYARIDTRFSDVVPAEDTGTLRAEVAMLRGSVDTLLANAAAPALVVESESEPTEEMQAVTEAAADVAEAAGEIVAAAEEVAAAAVLEASAELDDAIEESTEEMTPATPTEDTPPTRGSWWTRPLFGKHD